MAKMGFELNRDGVRELLKSPEMDSVLNSYADTISSSAGDGFAKHRYVGSKRIAYTITPESIEAAMKNQKNNILVKALGAARR